MVEPAAPTSATISVTDHRSPAMAASRVATPATIQPVGRGVSVVETER